MAVDVRRLDPDEQPPLRVVSSQNDPVAGDPIGEEFGYPVNRTAVRAPRKPRAARRRRLLPFLFILGLGAAALFVFRALGAGDDPPSPAATTAPTAVAPATAAAPVQPAGVPMSILSSRIVPAPAQTYRALVSVRNPTDVPAADVTITVTLKDGAGAVLKSDTRMLDVLPSGRTAEVEFTGELQTGSAAPAALTVQATASRLISPRV